MDKDQSTSMTRRTALTGLALTATTAAVLAHAGTAFAATAAPATTAAADKSLYERLGGVFAIAAVVDYFSDNVVRNRKVGTRSPNKQLREWSTKDIARLPGLKFERTLWVCDITGGPFKYQATVPGSTPLGLENAHRNLKISPAEFDEVARELKRALDHFKVPAAEQGEVLGAFAAHKDEVTTGYREAHGGA